MTINILESARDILKNNDPSLKFMNPIIAISYVKSIIGKDINAVDLNGVSALMLAAKFSNKAGIKCLNMLINAGADLNLRNSDGETALMIAIKFSNTTSSLRCAQILINAGANVNVFDHCRATISMILTSIKNSSATNDNCFLVLFLILGQYLRCRIFGTSCSNSK